MPVPRARKILLISLPVGYTGVDTLIEGKFVTIVQTIDFISYF